METDKVEYIRSKELEIMGILMDENITFGMARSIIQRVDADLQAKGYEHLRGTPIKDLPLTDYTNRRLYVMNGKNDAIL